MASFSLRDAPYNGPLLQRTANTPYPEPFVRQITWSGWVEHLYMFAYEARWHAWTIKGPIWETVEVPLMLSNVDLARQRDDDGRRQLVRAMISNGWNSLLAELSGKGVNVVDYLDMPLEVGEFELGFRPEVTRSEPPRIYWVPTPPLTDEQRASLRHGEWNVQAYTAPQAPEVVRPSRPRPLDIVD